MPASKGRALKRESRPTREGGRPNCEMLPGVSLSILNFAAYRTQYLNAHAIRPERAAVLAPFAFGDAGHD